MTLPMLLRWIFDNRKKHPGSNDASVTISVKLAQPRASAHVKSGARMSWLLTRNEPGSIA
jgi:hypothetical protein